MVSFINYGVEITSVQFSKLEIFIIDSESAFEFDQICSISIFPLIRLKLQNTNLTYP